MDSGNNNNNSNKVLHLKHAAANINSPVSRPTKLQPTKIEEQTAMAFIDRLLPYLHDVDTRLEELDAKFNKLLVLLSKQDKK